MYMNIYTSICIRIKVFIPYHKVDCYINTISDMQKEKKFFYHCRKFDYNHDFEQDFWNIDDAILEYKILDSNVYICEIDYHKFSF